MIFSIKDAPAKDSPIRPSDDRQKILAADNSFRGADYDYLGYLDDFLNYYVKCWCPRKDFEKNISCKAKEKTRNLDKRGKRSPL